MSEFNRTFITLSREVNQAHHQRKPYLEEITKFRDGRTVVLFFISFHSEVILSQEDADMIEEVLLNTDNSNGISLLLDSPGGDGLAAERIIQICRSYSKKDFEVIIPARAKSAATMVCLGADQIVMSPTSELGPIDPQVLYDMGNGPQWVAAHHIVESYDELFDKAVESKNADIAPYLQQLGSFNSVHVDTLRTAIELSKKIAISSLEKGMMSGKNKADIEEKIKPFIDPNFTKSHGRGITSEQAKECDLNVVEIDPNTELWKAVWGLYLRSKYVVNTITTGGKLVETLSDSFTA